MTQLLKLTAATAVGAILLVFSIIVLWPLSVRAAVNPSDRVTPIERSVPLRQCITPPMIVVLIEQWARRTGKAVEVAMFGLPDGRLRLVMVLPETGPLAVYDFAEGCLLSKAPVQAV